MRCYRALSFGNLKVYEKANEEYFRKSPDRPIHRPVQSLLASGSGFENFRGIINLGVFLLIILTSRLALENIIKYGIVVDPFLWLRYALHSPYKFNAIFSILYCNAFILCGHFIERAIVSRRLTESSALIVQCINLASTLVFPAAIILFSDFNPAFGVALLSIYTVVFLKLWSYAAVNRWCRTALHAKSKPVVSTKTKPLRSSSVDVSASPPTTQSSKLTEAGGDVQAPPSSSPDGQDNGSLGKDPETNGNSDEGDSTLRFRPNNVHISLSADSGAQSNPVADHASNVAPSHPKKALKQRSKSQEGGRASGRRPAPEHDVQYFSLTDIMEKEPQMLLSPKLQTTEFWGYLHQQYPDNLRLADLYYFMLAPTLCYELNFPRTVSIRRLFVLKRLFELVFLTQLMLCLVQQWMMPILQNSLVPIRLSSLSQVVERCLKLAIPNHLIWLMGFYAMFHSLLNLTGELTYFGDRFFYSDWWNAESVAAFWSKWNIPVHRFCRRHIYVPLLNSGFTRNQASLIVFFISAVLHEFLVSVPLKMPRMWAFLGMVSQMPYALLVYYLFPRGGIWGNIAVWITLIIGQPMAILFYFHDYYLAHYSV